MCSLALNTILCCFGTVILVFLSYVTTIEQHFTGQEGVHLVKQDEGQLAGTTTLATSGFRAAAFVNASKQHLYGQFGWQETIHSLRQAGDELLCPLFKSSPGKDCGQHFLGQVGKQAQLQAGGQEIPDV